jgi:hypothetical protein
MVRGGGVNYIIPNNLDRFESSGFLSVREDLTGRPDRTSANKSTCFLQE